MCTASLVVNGDRSLDGWYIEFFGWGGWVLVVGQGGVGDGLVVIYFKFSGIYLCSFLYSPLLG